MGEPKELYLAGYNAFNRGNFSEAIRLATQCLITALPGSYRHFGALGLRCWAKKYSGYRVGVERDGHVLLAGDGGADKPWFGGLALLNLGLAYQQAGEIAKAKVFFTQALERYAAHRIDSEQPSEWALVRVSFSLL